MLHLTLASVLSCSGERSVCAGWSARGERWGRGQNRLPPLQNHVCDLSHGHNTSTWEVLGPKSGTRHRPMRCYEEMVLLLVNHLPGRFDMGTFCVLYSSTKPSLLHCFWYFHKVFDLKLKRLNIDLKLGLKMLRPLFFIMPNQVQLQRFVTLTWGVSYDAGSR